LQLLKTLFCRWSIDLVNQILEKKANISSQGRNDTIELEKQIDQIVYKLYGLTPDEVKIM
jgi:hypothetical protein